MLLAVASEEDGGLGAFAALERDAAFDACLIPEPTSFEVVCAQAGALTFRATVRGRAAHAAMRLAGRSALDRYVGVHLAIQAHERAINRDVEHPAMRALALPYPVSVGRIDGGDWPSSVPDRVTVEGRLGVPLGHRPRRRPRRLRGRARRRRGAARRGRVDRRPVRARRHPARAPVGQRRRRRGARRARHPAAPHRRALRRRHAAVLRPRDPDRDGRHAGLELAHAVDERVSVADLAALARIIARALVAAPSNGGH